MTPLALWQRYAAIWSQPADSRADELKVCVADDVRYCDPNSSVEGSAALSGYMAAFQSNVVGGHFQIDSVICHHERMLAHWRLLGPNGARMQSGASFATVAADGRLESITGFFPLGVADQ
jgi:hypothetical protein